MKKIFLGALLFALLMALWDLYTEKELVQTLVESVIGGSIFFAISALLFKAGILKFKEEK